MSRPDGPLISAEQLHRALGHDPSLIVLDVSWRLGETSLRAEYDSEHLPGAAWVEFEEALSSEPGEGGRHPMPDEDAFVDAMRAAGVDNDERVVVYDRDSGLAAARLWWLLTYAGHESVQVLDGGLRRWRELGMTLSSDPVHPQRGDFVSTAPHRELLDADGAAEYADQHLLIDARPADRFRGQNETIDPVAGHIPGAVNAPALANLTDDGLFLTPDDLAMQFTQLGVRPDTKVGVYCGSGVQAMHAALALEASEIAASPAVYVGSWSHWITDPDRPVSGPDDLSRR